MDDLNSSPLFDKRHLEFMRRVLQGRPITPISAVEQKFLKYTPLIKTLDEELDYTLIRKLESWQDFISVQEAVGFLLGALKRKQLEAAIIILDTSVVENRSANVADLMTILDEAKTMPASWAIALHAQEINSRHEPEASDNLSRLNLEAMKNFR